MTEPSPERDDAHARAARRRRLAEVFGDDLPDQTSDDAPETQPRDGGDESSEEWLRRQVPPHHG